MRRLAAIFVLALAAAPFARAGEGLIAGPEIALPADGGRQGIRGEPAVAFGKDVYLVVWREGWHGEGGASRIHAARLSRDGKVLDAKPIEVAPEAKDVQDRPRVAFGGGVFLVVWQELAGGKQYDVRAARVSPEGKVLDARPIAVAAGPENETMPDVASDGNGFVVVWGGAVVEGGDMAFQVSAAPVSAAGAPGAAAKLFRGGVPQLAWDGKNYLVIGIAPPSGIRLDAFGKPVGTKTKWSSVINFGARAEVYERTFSIAGGGDGGWLVVNDRAQPDYWGWGGSGAMRAYFIGSDGTLDPGIKGEPSGLRSKLPYWLDINKKDAGWPSGASAVAWDGKRFVALWQRHHLEKQVMFTNCDLIAGRADGFKPLDPDGVPVAASDLEEKNPALASGGAGKLLCVYERYEKGGTVRICARTIKTR